MNGPVPIPAALTDWDILTARSTAAKELRGIRRLTTTREHGVLPLLDEAAASWARITVSRIMRQGELPSDIARAAYTSALLRNIGDRIVARRLPD